MSGVVDQDEENPLTSGDCNRLYYARAIKFDFGLGGIRAAGLSLARPSFDRGWSKSIAILSTVRPPMRPG
jgi:hypothetical protein